MQSYSKEVKHHCCQNPLRTKKPAIFYSVAGFKNVSQVKA